MAFSTDCTDKLPRLRRSIACALTAPSIAVLGLLAAAALPAAATQGSGGLRLPPFENTPEEDLRMTREITDTHVYRPAPTAVVLAAPAAAAPGVAIGATPSDGQPVADAEPGGTAATLPEPLPADDAWARIRQSSRIPLNDHPRVREYREQYRREALWISRILYRGEPFLGHLVNALEARYLPVELAMLPAIESGFLPDAVSAGQAAGLWQIVPITAREIGIRRSVWFDGRADIVTSTTAALDYLSYLNAEFNGDWELTLAAYNAGPGRVRSAVRRNRAAGKPTDFWSLELPRETRNYIPKFVALLQLIKTPAIDGDGFAGFDMPSVGLTPNFEAVDVNMRISLDKAAMLADVPEAHLRRLNAGLVHAVTEPRGPHRLYLPTGTAKRFLDELARADKTRLFSLPKTHAVVAGDTISSIALKYGISQQRLRDMNGLDGSRIMIGQRLAVVDARQAAASRIDYTVKIGDTLSEIAEEFAVDLGDITDEQGRTLPDDIIHPGQTLHIAIALADTG